MAELAVLFGKYKWAIAFVILFVLLFAFIGCRSGFIENTVKSGTDSDFSVFSTVAKIKKLQEKYLMQLRV
jgi:hypothetical protein